MSIVCNMVGGGSGGGSGATKLMTQGQVSRVSAYMTATFDAPISDYDFVEVHLFYNDADSGVGLSLIPTTSTTFTIRASYNDTVTFSLTPTTIAITNYSTAWKALFVDVYGYHFAE